MAARKGGLGKGLDSMIVNTSGPRSRKNRNAGNNIPLSSAQTPDAAINVNNDNGIDGKSTADSASSEQGLISHEIPDQGIAKSDIANKEFANPDIVISATNSDTVKKNSREKKDSDKTSASSADKVIEDIKLPISKVEPNREQPRKNFDEEALNELAESIKQFGILQPILVQKKDSYYEIIAGERRWRAAKIAGLKEVPVIIKQLSPLEIMEISLIENIQREDLNPIEEAMAYKTLIDEFHLKQEELADKVSKSRTAVANSMRLLKLDPKVQQMVIDGILSTGHARTIISLTDSVLQCQVAQQIIDKKLSVRDTEKLVKNLLMEKKNKEKKPKLDSTLDAIYRDLENQLKKSLGTKVVINSKNEKSGKVEIEYYSQEELEKIIDLLRN